MRHLVVALVSISVIFLLSCASQEVKKTEEPVVKSSVDHGAWVKQANSKLSKIPVSGFAYKGTDVPPQKWDKWAETAAPVVSGIISNMPEGYVLQVTGHTDSRGPEEPEGDKPGNIKISNDRAEAVYNALKRKGVSSGRMTYKGVGSSQPIGGLNPRSSAQRRVTFEVVPE